MIPVLYDGWELARQPVGPAATHLLAVFDHLPEQVQAFVALPEEPPAWLPGNVTPLIAPTEDHLRQRFAWEQIRLPSLAKKTGASLLHTCTPAAPLFSRLECFISPAGFDLNLSAQPQPGSRAGLFPRLRAAFSQGGLARGANLLWPAGLPRPAGSLGALPSQTLPPVVSPGYHPFVVADSIPQLPEPLPESYILYHGPAGRQELANLFAAWKWASASIGGSTPLLILGIEQGSRASIQQAVEKAGLQDTIKACPPVDPRSLPALYQRCAALVRPAAAVSPWGDPLYSALACGRPIIAAGAPVTDALVGPAAYLVPPGDERALGAALITVVIEQSVAAALSQAAVRQSSAWDSGRFGEQLLRVYLGKIG